jgi:hypothetical protein
MLLNDVGAPEFFIQQLAIGWKVTIWPVFVRREYQQKLIHV